MTQRAGVPRALATPVDRLIPLLTVPISGIDSVILIRQQFAFTEAIDELV